MPSYAISQIVGVQPIQIQNLVGYLSGEIEGFDAAARSLGLHTGTTYPGAGAGDAPEIVKFRENLREVKIASETFKYLVKQDRAKAREYDIKTDKLRKFAPSFRKTSARLNKLKNRKSLILESTRTNKKELIDRIDAKMIRIAERQNKIYLDRRK